MLLFEFTSSSACPCSSLVCAPWQKTRPNRKRRPFTSFCFLFFEKFLFCSSLFVCVCPAAWKSPLVIPWAWEFGGIAASAASPLAASPHARQCGRYPPPAVTLPSPPAGCLVPGLPLPQARRSREITPPARLWLNACRPPSDSMLAGPPLTQCPPARRWLKPAGSPLTQAHRIAADSSPPDRRWLKPAGLALTHARRPPLSLAPWIKSTCHGQECRVSVLLCPQEHFKEPCLVHGDSSGAGGSSCCGHGGHSSRLPPCRGGGSGSCGMSCPVCLCLAPEGSWYPLTSPGKFWGGVVWVPAVGAGPRGPRPRPPKYICHGLLSSLHCHGLQSCQLRCGITTNGHLVQHKGWPWAYTRVLDLASGALPRLTAEGVGGTSTGLPRENELRSSKSARIRSIEGNGAASVIDTERVRCYWPHEESKREDTGFTRRL